VSFEDADYAVLSALARRRDVSIEWVVRQAVHAFIERKQTESSNLELPFIPHLRGPNWDSL
jgi:predicted transcriptional regulator